MTHLLDGNVLVSLLMTDHLHHETTHRWWRSLATRQFATCPITQGTLLRIAIREGIAAARAQALLKDVCSMDGHEFWPDLFGYDAVPMAGVIGHRQVTDAYLAQLAREHSGRLATIDAGLAASHPDVADLLPIG